jgi:hypothetical protein
MTSELNVKKIKEAGCSWFMPVILATQEAEIKRITGSKPVPVKS